MVHSVNKDEFTEFEYSIINFVMACCDKSNAMTPKGIHCYAKTIFNIVKKGFTPKICDWTDEEETVLHNACEFIRHRLNDESCRNGSIGGMDYKVLYEKLKSLRPVKQELSEEEKEKIVFEKIMSLGYPIDANGNYATCEELFESAKLGLSQWLKEQISRLEMRKSISLSSDGVKTERLIKENYLQAYREGMNDIINLLSEATPSLSKCSPRKPVEPCDINIRKMVEDYRCRDEYDEDGNYKGKPVNCMVRAYEQGIRDILKTLK